MCIFICKTSRNFEYNLELFKENNIYFYILYINIYFIITLYVKEFDITYIPYCLNIIPPSLTYTRTILLF